jgi:hypothetical protein
LGITGDGNKGVAGRRRPTDVQYKNAAKQWKKGAATLHLVILSLKLGSAGEFMDDHMSLKLAGLYLMGM